MVLNTGVMYTRMIITMIVTLLSSRWVLLALGKEDFGIFNLVSGLLSMLMFLNMTMATASQRFLSYALGRGDTQEIRDTFYYSCVLHFIIGVIIVLGIEIVGQVLLFTVLQVPAGKMNLALFCLHSLSVSTFITVVSVPYSAILISHENIVLVSIVHIGEALLKLATSIVLLYYMGSRLKLYAVCMALIPSVSVFIYRMYCHRHYSETHIIFKRITDKTLFRKFTSYAGWNLIGSISSLLRTQGVAMLLNSFYGVLMNAAYGIATQVKGQLTFFSSAIVTSTRPQIVKSEGAGNRKRALALSAMTCKVTFLLLSMIAVPLVIEMPYVLTLWLKNVPEYAVSFTRLIVLLNVVFQFAIGLSIPIESVGNIKQVQLVVGGMHFIVIPIGYVMLKAGLPPQSVFVMIIAEECVGIILRLFISHKVTGLDIVNFIKETLVPSVVTSISGFLFCFFIVNCLEEGFLRLALLVVLSVTFFFVVSYIYTLTKAERMKINAVVKRISSKIF